MTYNNALKWIHSAPEVLEDTGSKERLARLWGLLAFPKRSFKYLRVAGACGKTVCAELLSAVYENSPYTVGCLLMPLRGDFRDNILVNNRSLSFEELSKYADRIRVAIKKLNQAPTDAEQTEDSVPHATLSAPICFTRHELLLTVALLAFLDKGCRLCIIESEGSAEDPTRFLPAPQLLSLCGPIDTTDEEEIRRIHSYASHGIRELICSFSGEKGYQFISKVCAKVNCRLTLASPRDAEIRTVAPRECVFFYRGTEYRTALFGAFQIENFILVSETLHALGRLGFPLPEEEMQRRLCAVRLPCRCEILSLSPTIVVDSSHYTSALRTVCDSLWDIRSVTGESIHICAPEGALAHETANIFRKKGYRIASILTLPYEEVTEYLPEQKRYKQIKRIRELSKQILDASKQGDMVYLCGPAPFAERLRHELLSQMGFIKK